VRSGATPHRSQTTFTWKKNSRGFNVLSVRHLALPTEAEQARQINRLGVGAIPGSLVTSRTDWLLLLRRVASIMFGVLAFIWPGLTLVALIFLWGAYAIVDGVIALWAAISGRGAEIAPRWWLAIVGIVGLLAGLAAFASPGLTALVLLMFIAGWAIVIGVLEIWGAIQLRKEIEGEWWLILSGLLSIAFGVLLIAWPGSGALALVWVIASFAILHGCTLIALAFRLKQFRPE
jgi:uncharacterized membrane protein HdeD (DUF308 family)